MKGHAPHLRVSVDSLYLLKKKNWEYLDSLENIVFIRSIRDEVVVHCRDLKKVIAFMTMKNLVILLPKQKFIRIHRQYIVNLEFVKEYNKNTLYMKNGKTFPIGKVYRTATIKVVPRKKTEKKAQVLQMAA